MAEKGISTLPYALGSLQRFWKKGSKNYFRNDILNCFLGLLMYPISLRTNLDSLKISTLFYLGVLFIQEPILTVNIFENIRKNFHPVFKI